MIIWIILVLWLILDIESLKSSGKSRADLWAFAAKVAIEYTTEVNNYLCDGRSSNWSGSDVGKTEHLCQRYLNLDICKTVFEREIEFRYVWKFSILLILTYKNHSITLGMVEKIAYRQITLTRLSKKKFNLTQTLLVLQPKTSSKRTSILIQGRLLQLWEPTHWYDI